MGLFSKFFGGKSVPTIVNITRDMSVDEVETLVRNIHTNSQIVFPEGIFELNLEIRGKRNVVIRGAGSEKTRIRSRGQALKLHDVEFVKGDQAVVIYVENSLSIRLEQLSAEGGEHGILWVNSKGSVEGCYSYDNKKGIGIGGIGSELDVRDSKSESNWQGVVLFGNSSGEIVGNYIFGNKGSGINLHSSRATINDNRIHDNGENGIHLGRRSDGIITENEVLHNADEGINLVNSDGTIASNTCEDNGSHGIALNDGSYAAIENNSCSNNKGSGIALIGSKANRINDNTSTNNALYGVCVALNSEAGIGNNDVRGNKNGEIYQD